MKTLSSPAARTGVDDSELVRRVSTGDSSAFEGVMRKYNGRLFRIARSIVKDDSDAEDVLQDAYFDAYRHMSDFRGSAQLGTWLGRIVINHSLMRVRKDKRRSSIVPFESATRNDSDEPEHEMPDQKAESPSTHVLRGEIRRILEQRIDELPAAFRTVFVMREVEGMSVEEAAECLSLPAATIRTRLFRARALLREALARDVDLATGGVFGFAGARCDRIVAAVMARLNALGENASSA
jgi:RNA polymerase sigma factor (sigma-70 family)